MEDDDDHRHGHTPTTLVQHFSTTYSNSINRFPFFFNRSRITTSPSNHPSTPAAAIFQSEDWSSYSKPLIIVDVVWNLAFVFVSLLLLLSTLKERPSTPLRVWIGGYGLQCLLHVGFVYAEHRHRERGLDAAAAATAGDGDAQILLYTTSSQTRLSSVTKRLESMNTMVSFFWWVVGFYWIVVGGQALLQDAPRLYWLTVVFLAFDVFFAIFCVVLACMIGIALFCCLPCIIVMLYSVVVREGASDNDIRVLPRYRFRPIIEPQLTDMDWKQHVSVMEMESSGDSLSEMSLPPEDSECCICLSKYVDGVELHGLPCNHYFHSGCIVRWLRINAKCPLCKFNILDDELV